MLDLVKKVLASHKCQMDRSREQYTRDLAGMSWTQRCGTGHRCQRLFVWAEKVGVVLKLVFVKPATPGVATGLWEACPGSRLNQNLFSLQLWSSSVTSTASERRN